MGTLRALPYSRFIHVICLMGAYIGLEKEGAFLIYQSNGTGYMPLPFGPRCSFMSRPPDEMVTVAEIEAALTHLRFSAKIFVETEKACLIPSQVITDAAVKPKLS